jgi:hypothetical protein
VKSARRSLRIALDKSSTVLIYFILFRIFWRPQALCSA